ncbi:COMM domain-containing protein 4 isoform X1 [Tachypleus tridentatus]|uniref:COMM domain-containing protein 4 isoform X1 n=2 Tax=Tachypleus tridentatus TaxID=6853 RepID=UPI003FD13CF8
MRFKFCGDLDCPDWVLAEINTLSKITSVKMKLLCNHVVNDIIGKGIDYEKVSKLTTDAKYAVGDIKASVAALDFILSSATKHRVAEETLSNELQQLGLPKEHTSSLCKVFSDKFPELLDHMKQKSLRLSRLEDVHWRVDYIIGSSVMQEVNEPSVQICLKVKDLDSVETRAEAFSLSPDKFRVLLHDLKEAYKMMEGLG